MTNCKMCGTSMIIENGCIEHKILLSNGDVITSPKHDSSGSLSLDHDECPDCAAEQDEYHHPHCDWARKPDGSQILIDAITYWNPETETDPRDVDSEYVFVLSMKSEYDTEWNVSRAFESLSAAERAAGLWEKFDSEMETRIKPVVPDDYIPDFLTELE